MARPPLALGHHGTIKVTRDGGQWIARCRIRDLDGVTRRVARWASSRTAAQKALQDELGQRRGERIELLRPQSTFRDAATVWAAKIAERREDSTADTYRHWLDGLVLPPARRATAARVRRRPHRRLLQPAGTSPADHQARRRHHHREDPVRGEHPPHHPSDRDRCHAAGRAAPGCRLQPGPASSNASSPPRATARHHPAV